MMERTLRSLQDAIKANHAAQETVKKQIELIARRKIENRRKAASLQVPLTCMVDGPSDPSNRPWTRSFFVDQSGNIPPPNDDTKRKIELEMNQSLIGSSTLWSKNEVARLHNIINTMYTTCDGEAIDFRQVATSLNNALKSNRSAEECQVKYQPNRTPFTKKESLTLLKKFHNGEELLLPKRTKWQAFQAFHSAADHNKVPWTLDQDEVLFKTVAAAGPQQVLSQHFASHLSGVLQKNPKTILQRTMTSLLNPVFVNDMWSDEDERRLCLLMKVYRDSPNPMVSVTSHFLTRSSRSVHDKWSRTLDPSYELDKHYTPEEDAKLKQLKGTVDWKVAEKDFPGRLSQSLAKRWKDLVSKQEVVEELSRNLKRKFKDFDEDDVVLRVKTNERSQLLKTTSNDDTQT